MSLTKTDLNQIQKLVDTSLDKKLKVNNDELFGKLMLVLKEFPTRQEVDSIVELRTEGIRKDINELKDDMVEVKQDISMLKVSVQALADYLHNWVNRVEDHDRDIMMIKTHLRLS